MKAQPTGHSPIAWVVLPAGATAFGAVSWYAWNGQLGWMAVGLLALATVGFVLGRRVLVPAKRKLLDTTAKAIFTAVGIMALLRHRIDLGAAVHLPIYQAIAQYIQQVDAKTFALFGVVAMIVKFVGVIASAFAWHLLLIGQRIRFPFWSAVMTAFLIGRFIGTFLPSTIGLDGYTLYEAGHYSNQWSRATTAKALEKFIGITGLFLGMLVTLPFGYQVIVDVTEQLGRPEAAPLLAGAIVVIAGGVTALVVIMLAWPLVLIKGVTSVGHVLPVRFSGRVQQLALVVGAYKGQVGLLLLALFSKFITHFNTAAVYYFTALAIGVVGAQFWPITFGSTIQILATVLSPTIAGEGAREAFQALLLSKHLGGVAQAVLSAALGFIAAEAATMWGGMFLWVRHPGWRPRFALVEGRQVDYIWIQDPADAGFDKETA